MATKLSDEQKAKKYAYTKQWKEQNKDKVREQKRKYYAENREKIIQQQTDSINRNPERRKKTSEYWRQYSRDNYEARLLTSIKSRAKKKGIDFNLELSDLIIPEFCPKTGISLVKHRGNSTNDKFYDTPSVDRIDCSKGYIKGNIQIVCYWYNVAKLTFTDKQMLEFCKKVIEHG